MQHSLKRVLQCNLARVVPGSSVGGSVFRLANGSDEKRELYMSHQLAHGRKKAGAKRRDLKKGEVRERLSDVPSVKVRTFVRPIAEFQSGKRGHDFAPVVLSLNDDSGENK